MVSWLPSSKTSRGRAYGVFQCWTGEFSVSCEHEGPHSWVVLKKSILPQLTMKFPALWNPMVRYCVHKSQPLESIVSQLNPVHLFTHFSKIVSVLSPICTYVYQTVSSPLYFPHVPYIRPPQNFITDNSSCFSLQPPYFSFLFIYFYHQIAACSILTRTYQCWSLFVWFSK